MIKKQVKGLLVSAVALAFMPMSVGAQSRPSLDVTLDKCIEIALAENPTIKVAENEIELKKVADSEAWQNLLPTVEGSLSMQHSIKVAEIRTSMGSFKMGMDGSTTAIGGVTVAIPVFAPAVYQNMKMTKDDILLAQEKARSSRLDLINQVTKAYYGALLAKDSRDVVQKSYDVSKQYYNLIENMFNVGRVSEYDKISAEVQMRSMGSTLVNTENGLSLALLQLKVLMGITADVDININDELRKYESSLTLANIESEGVNLDNNTNLKQMDMNINMLEHARKILKTNFMPTAGLQLQGQYQSMSNQDWNIFKYQYSPSLTLSLGVTIPIFKASNWTKLKSNKIQTQQLIDTRENTRRQLGMAVESYRKNMFATISKLESDRVAVSQAEKAVTISAKRYDVGKGTVLELNQSETALTQAELTYNQAIYDFLTNKADLEYTLGKAE